MSRNFSTSSISEEPTLSGYSFTMTQNGRLFSLISFKMFVSIFFLYFCCCGFQKMKWVWMNFHIPEIGENIVNSFIIKILYDN